MILCVTFRQTAMFNVNAQQRQKNRRSILSSAVDFLKTVLLKDVHKVIGNSDYFMLTSAPSASSLALISSASALETPSLSVFGALSTSSFASFSPRPVISRTALITLTLEAPADTSSTSNSSFSSAAAPPSAAAATTTPAAADTPNSSSHAFTNSFNSNTDNSLIASISCCHFSHF